MSDKAQATDTPWTVVEVKTASGLAYKIGSGEMLDVGKGCCIIYDDYPGDRPSPHRKKADRIVTAVNAYEALVLSVKFFDAMHRGDLEEQIRLGWSPEGYDTTDQHARKLREAALRLAEGEKE